MKRNSQGFSIIGFLIAIVTIAIPCMCSVLMYDYINTKTNGNRIYLVIFIAIAILIFSLVYTIIDIFRRKHMIEKPVNKILEATEKIAQGDFNVNLTAINPLDKYNEFDFIIENLNIMSAELSKNEVLKNDFIANVSHEIKTPLSVIQNYATLLKTKNLTEKQREEYINNLINATKRLSNLVTNILKLNKLEHQQIINNNKKYNLGEQLRECVLNFVNLIDEKGLELICDIDDVEIFSAEEYLEIVWQNLISNAIKFTDKGQIKIELKRENEFASIKVSDTGIGISKEVGNRIFEKFYQEDESRSNLGNGLGLALVKKVIDIIGGQISIDSKLGEGTTFNIKIRINIDD